MRILTCACVPVLECPTINYLNSLLECDAFRPHQTNTTLQDVASLIVHFTPKDVLCNELYQEFMHRFHHTTDHIIINESNCGPSSVAVHKIQHKLNMINGCLFPLLKEDMVRYSQY